MAIPINRVQDTQSDYYRDPYTAQDMTVIIPLLQNPFVSLQSATNQDVEKKLLKKIWLESKSIGNNAVKIGSSISENDLRDLRQKGLIEADFTDNQKIVKFTDRGSKLLRDAILSESSDYKFSSSKQLRKTAEAQDIGVLKRKYQWKNVMTKRASKEIVSKNSYDFGDEVLVRVKDVKKFGTKYISIKKAIFEKNGKIAQKVEPKNLEIKKDLSLYSDEDLIKMLYMAKNIVSNQNKIWEKKASTGEIVSIRKIRKLATVILEELNSEKRIKF